MIPNRKLKEIVYVMRNFSSREKIVFFALCAIFTTSFLSALWLISDSYMVEIPADGGSLTEGIVGTPRFINPLLAVSDVDRDIINLIYSGLMRPDNNGGLIPDLAEKFEISQDGLSYTFTLKPDLIWQDGKPLTTDDIIFTIQQAKDQNLKSPKRANWEGVEIEKIDDRLFRFVLKKPYAPFLENTIIGILPKHIWNNAISEQMSFSEFNIEPIGSGPYKIENIKRNSSGIITSCELSPNKNFALEKPHIKKITFRFYSSEKEILNAYQRGEINSISAISPKTTKEIAKNNSNLITPLLSRAFGIFFNQNNAPVLSYKEVRQALNAAIDKKKIVEEVIHGFGIKLDYPVPAGTFGAIKEEENAEPPLNDTITQAKNILKNNGWTFNEKENIWQKTIPSINNKKKKETIKLEFSLSTSDTPELKQTAEILKSMWEKIGAKITIKIFEIGDLNQNVIRPRKYDALLFGEILGREPDLFAFWHSSQRNDPGLNIAMYANVKTDKLLEEARITFDDEKRREKYEEFQKEIIKDLPVIFLYSPEFIYLLPDNVRGVKMKSITISSERFSQIYKWYVKTDRVWKIFAK